MKILIKSLSILFISVISCSLQNVKTNQTVEIDQQKVIEFEEINHVNVKLIDSEYEILKSQAAIDLIYKKINDNNPSPRKNPIPSYNENETYIVLQPKIAKSDFTVEGISESNETLKIKIQQYDNPEFRVRKFPISVIKISKAHKYNTIEIIK